MPGVGRPFCDRREVTRSDLRRSRARPWLVHLRDRWLVGLTLVRLALAVLLLSIPAFVPVPGAELPQPITAFLPLAIAVPAALSLRERLGWLGTGAAGHRLAAVRMASSLAADALVLGTCWVLVAVTATEHDGLLAAVSCAATIEGIGYLVGIVSARFAWLVTAALGSAALLGLPPHGVPLVFSLPPWIGPAAYAIGFIASSAAPSRRQGSEG